MREYLLVLFVAAATTYLLGGLVRRAAARLGAVTAIRDRDVHSAPIPRLGGLAILGGVSAAFIVATNLPFLGALPEVSGDAWAILLAGFVIALVGALDDLVDLDGITKLAGMVVAAGIVVVFGVQLNWIPLPDGSTFSLSPSLGAAVTALAIVVGAVAVNSVDGLDGLAAGVACIGAAAFFSYSYLLAFQYGLNRATTATLITAAVTGACLGFLPHNFFPARVFMGDSGAYLIGLMLATSTISLTGYLDASALPSDGQRPNLFPALLPLVLPIAVLALPFADLVMAVTRRVLAGKSPFDADRRHLHHRVHFELGHSHKAAVLILYMWAGVVAFGVVALGLWPTLLTVGGVGGAIVLAVLITVLLPRRRLPAKLAALAPSRVKSS